MPYASSQTKFMGPAQTELRWCRQPRGEDASGVGGGQFGWYCWLRLAISAVLQEEIAQYDENFHQSTDCTHHIQNNSLRTPAHGFDERGRDAAAELLGNTAVVLHDSGAAVLGESQEIRGGSREAEGGYLSAEERDEAEGGASCAGGGGRGGARGARAARGAREARGRGKGGRSCRRRMKEDARPSLTAPQFGVRAFLDAKRPGQG
eukprot:456398-Rhodomonas_salina.2